MSKIQEVEEKLRKAIEAALKEGWLLSPGSMFPDTLECCALGAVVRDHYPDTINSFYIAVTRLDLTAREALCLARGFDKDDKFPNMDSPYYRLGATLRQDYLKE